MVVVQQRNLRTRQARPDQAAALAVELIRDLSSQINNIHLQFCKSSFSNRAAVIYKLISCKVPLASSRYNLIPAPIRKAGVLKLIFPNTVLVPAGTS